MSKGLIFIICIISFYMSSCSSSPGTTGFSIAPVDATCNTAACVK